MCCGRSSQHCSAVCPPGLLSCCCPPLLCHWQLKRCAAGLIWCRLLGSIPWLCPRLNCREKTLLTRLLCQPCQPVTSRLSPSCLLSCLLFFSSSSARQIPREAEAGDGLALPGSRLGNGEAREYVLAGPCAGLLQRVATHLCTDLTVFLKPTAFFSAVAQELKSKPSHPLWVLRSLP